MNKQTTEGAVAIPSSLIDDVCARLAENKRIRQPLPGGGSLHIDRLLPFLCVYRDDPTRRDQGTSRFVTSEASHLVARGEAQFDSGLDRLVQRIAQTAAGLLGAFLIVEIWTGDERAVPRELDTLTGENIPARPGFRIMARRLPRPEGTVSSLEFALQRVKLNRLPSEVEINLGAQNHPATMAQFLSEAEESRINGYVLGLEVRPVFRDPGTGEVYQNDLQTLRRQVSKAIKKTCFAFASNRTKVRPEHYFSLGSSSLPKQILTVDRQLAEVSSQFKFLLLVTPMNAERSWHEFSESGYCTSPAFYYRPLDADPLLLKRRLTKIATEKVDDPTLAHVMRQTQMELDRQLTMLSDIGTARFLPGSLQVFGRVDKGLYELAEKILARLKGREEDESMDPPAVPELSTGPRMLDAPEFARLATEEIKYYQQYSATFQAQATVREDIYSGLLASGGNLLIGRETLISARRAHALLQHEVGTHLVTYHNGSLQPLRLLKVGLAAYDTLQEGFAVLSEYLVNGLSRGRMRTLAARVIATHELIRESPFPDVFQQLVDEFGFEPRTAYTITLRVFRAGGLTKDALYLRGLVEVLQFLGKGGDVEPLLVGKIALNHVPVVKELLMRGILNPPTLRPRFLDLEEVKPRLAGINSQTTVLDLIDEFTSAD